MEAAKLIELLNKEREYHATHPGQVYAKTLSGMGASLAAVVAAIYFSGKISKSELSGFVNSLPIFWVLSLFGLGIISIFIGLAEHSYIHGQQRKRIENALAYIFSDFETFQFEQFWFRYNSTNLVSLFKASFKIATPLFTSEPDTRNYWGFHDRKFDLGGLLIFIAYSILIVHAF